RNPQWHGETTKMVYRWPSRPEAKKLWDRYVEIWRRCNEEDRPTDEATQLVRDNFFVMHEGAQVGWPQRFNADEASALQHAFNVIAERGEAAFRAEYQNEPIRPKSNEERPLVADALCKRLNRVDRGLVPAPATHLTGMIDCSAEVLYWLVAAWE